MLDFLLKEKLNVSKSEFFSLFFGDNTFKTKFHKARGDQDVDVSDWISLASKASPVGDNGLFQRVCFFTIFEQNATEKMGTRCLETQRKEHKTNSNNEEDIEIYSNIVPENPLGNIFKIEAKWRVNNEGEGCVVVIEGMVECNKKMWGVQSYAERLLQQMAMNLHTEWVQLAKRQLKENESEAAKKRMEEQQQQQYQQQGPDEFSRMVSSNREVQRVFLSGTEKIVTLLSSSPPYPSLLEEPPTEERPSYRFDGDHDRKEGCFASITINPISIDEHDDSDLGVPKRRRMYRQRTHWYAIVGVLSVIFLLCFALWSR